MNIFQRILATIFRPYKFGILRKEQGVLFSNIVSALPAEFQEVKEQITLNRFLGFSDWEQYPGYKFIYRSYSGETVNRLKKRGQSFKISGLHIYSKKNRRFEEIELLIQDNLLDGIKITNSNYELKEFDLTKIVNKGVTKSPFAFQPSQLDTFYNSLDQSIKDLLNPDDIFDIEFNNRTFYSFYDMEDGNYLAVDKNLKVYSLIQDARPMATKMAISFSEILSDIKNSQFDFEKHFEERYKNSKSI